MHILCTICSDIVNQAENIYVTKCGHLFHHHCLSQWIERSRTCPQCRCSVSARGMWRVFPTAGGGGAEDAGAVQARLDDVMLQLRQQQAALHAAQQQEQRARDDAAAQQELLKASEKKLLSKESAVAALREQLEYVKVQNKETHRLKEQNEQLKKTMQTLNGLEKVLHSTAEEVEQMLQGYTDVRTIATFATALKRALCEAEAAKAAWREQLGRLRAQLARETARLHDQLGQTAALREELAALRRERDAACERDSARERDTACERDSARERVSARERDAACEGDDACERDSKRRRAEPTPEPAPEASPDVSVGSLARRAAAADSPYLQLRASGVPHPGLQRGPRALHHLKPSEMALVKGAQHSHSIFGVARAGVAGSGAGGGGGAGGGYDGLGGHARADPSPAPRALPRPGVRHRLRAPAPAPGPGPARARAGADIAAMFRAARGP